MFYAGESSLSFLDESIHPSENKFNHFATDNTLFCGERFVPVKIS